MTPDGRRLLAAESAADELAVFALPSGKPVGRIPTLAYPADVQATRQRLLWIAAKGLGAGPNRNGPNPYTTNDNNLLLHPGTAVMSPGRAGILTMPTDRQIRRFSALANRQVIPTNAEPAPPGTPLRAGGPIKHVFFIIRENRTYDQVLGDDRRGDGAPALTLFGQRVTPNIHALVRRFPLLDHVYANSEASIDGHFWTSAGAVSDYVQKNWEQNYAGRDRPYDFGAYTITWPGTGFLFDRAQRQGISYANYGEVVAGTIPPSVLKLVGVTDKNAGPAQSALETEKFRHSKVGFPFDCYPNDLSNRDRLDRRLAGRQARRDVRLLGSPRRGRGLRVTVLLLQGDVRQAGRVRDRARVQLPGPPQRPHQRGLARRSHPARDGRRERLRPRTMVDLISHSSIWSSSAIFVIEDDSQDGPDHVDAHRLPAGVFSPYAKAGAVIHTRYDMLSMIRSIELILGMKALGLSDAVATPMYDAFQSTPSNSAPFNALSPTYPLLGTQSQHRGQPRPESRLRPHSHRPRAAGCARPHAVVLRPW